METAKNRTEEEGLTGVVQLPTVLTPSAVVMQKSPKLGTMLMTIRTSAAPWPPVGLHKEV